VTKDTFQTQLLEVEDAISTLCKSLAVRRLRIFGSAVNGGFDPARSDIDLVVDFIDIRWPGIADRFLVLAESLERIFRCPVDLLTENAVKNPIFRKAVDSTSRTIYDAGSQ